MPLVLLVLLLVPGALVSRAGPRGNWAALRAHRLLWSAQLGKSPPPEALSVVAQDLNAALQADGDNVHLHNLLGRVLSWLEQHPDAIEALSRQVELDGQNALARYDPSESLRRRIMGQEAEDDWQNVLRLYQRWLSRYPQRAELYMLTALVRHLHQDDPQGAAAVLKVGIERQAEPRGLLLYGLSQLSGSVPEAAVRIPARVARRGDPWEISPSPALAASCQEGPG